MQLQVLQLVNIYSICKNYDGNIKYLDQTAKIWNADTGRCLLSYTGHSGSVNSVAIYPENNADELIVLTASGDRSAHLWKTNRNYYRI